MKTTVLICGIIIPALFACSQAQEQKLKTHPWASFNNNSWVEVHTWHRMAMEGQDTSVWEGDSKITVVKAEQDKVTIRHEAPSMNIKEEVALPVPAPDELPGVRALGQWPHDIFPMGPERQSGITATDMNPFPENISVKELDEKSSISVQGKTYDTRAWQKEWDVPAKDGKRHYTLKAWVAEGVELPLKWTVTTSDGSDDSETEVVNLQENVKVGEKEIPCLVTVTNKKSQMGEMVKKRWSSTQVPGFMVKMETEMKSPGFSMEVKEYITGYSAD